MTLRPLPVPTRLYGGEDVDTYARRAAERNGTQERWIGNALWSDGVVVSLSRRHPTRLQAWRELGDLHPSAFTTPDTVAGEWVTDRRKCVQCSGGHSVYGRFPRAGWVCLRHRRWLAGTQPRIDPPSPLLAAERHYRNHLASRHILFDGAAMRLGAECARVAVSPADITARQEATGLPLEAVIYPEQVAFCRVATRSSLLSWALDPDTEPADVRRVLDAECRRVVPDDGDSEPWRASTRLQTVLFALRVEFRERLLSRGRAWSWPDRWNLLRHVWEDAD